MLNIYKASAGSGKTFQLVLEFLKLALAGELNYRRILAVTFTNKATAEMKKRILEQLHKLSLNSGSEYLDQLVKETGMTRKEITISSKKILENILFDYHRFSVSTIDKFTQGVIKAFNREIGISPAYMVELDNELLLNEAIDRLIAEAGNDGELIDWLVRLASEKITSNLSFNIEKDLFKIGNELFKEKFQNLSVANQNKLPDIKALKEIQTELNEIIARYQSFLTGKAKIALKAMADSGLSLEDFSRGKGGPAGFFFYIADKNFIRLRNVDINSTESTDKWFAQKSLRKEEIGNLAQKILVPLMKEVISFCNDKQTEYFTALEAKKNIYTFGAIIDLKVKLDQIRYEKDILPISDANLFLNRIIEGSDSPFIYEKTGNRYFHYLLDEFQDTSVLQWENFLPLIKNSLAYGKLSIVVGDVKQSIYRWRNSDWKILASKIHDDFNKELSQTTILHQNWRSRENIVEFNNGIFPLFVGESIRKIEKDLSTSDSPSIAAWIELLKKSYSDVIQTLPAGNIKSGGYIEINQLDAEGGKSFNEITLELLLEQVKSLQDKGVPPSETVILIRKKNEGISIVDYFLKAAELEENRNYNLSILSNESLFLTNSRAVQFILLIIRYFIDRDNPLIRAGIMQIFFTCISPALKRKGEKDWSGIPSHPDNITWHLSADFVSEFNTLLKPIIERVFTLIRNNSVDEAIIKISDAFRLFLLDAELPYIQTLIDKSSELKQTTLNDFSGFINWWDENGSGLSITLNETGDAIRLMTIHTAKGLEFDSVLLPFFSWSMNHPSNNQPILWSFCDHEPFNRFNLIPVKFSKGLLDTWFSDDYIDEYISNIVDNLNLAYVAFTRAKSALFINLPGKNKADCICNLVVNNLPSIVGSLLKENDKVTGRNKWISGILNSYVADTGKSTEIEDYITPEQYYYTDFSERLKFRLNSEDFLLTSENEKPSKNTGKMLHEILSHIILESEIGTALKKAVAEKKISAGESAEISEWFEFLLSDPDAKSWFSGRYEVYNERSVLTRKTVHRPDRIMVEGTSVVVLDYKAGESRSFSHIDQVKDYAVDLKKAGFIKVTAYLWYVRKNLIEKVCDL